MSTYGTLNADLIGNSNGQTGNAIGPGFKNRIINGDMRIDQRNAGAAVTPANGAVTYTVDRWAIFVNQASKLTAQRSTTAPNGFTNSLLVTSSSAYAPTSNDVFNLFQPIEGFNFADLGWGTANAKTITISFWVRASVTGTYSSALSNGANNRFYLFNFVVNTADTWELKTITISGDTSGTWATDNSTGIHVRFDLGAGSNFVGTAGAWGSSAIYKTSGSVNLVATSGATFYITGVQLEVGSSATSFDYRPYGTELSLCQRYYYKLKASGSNGFFAVGTVESTTVGLGITVFPVTPRAAPSALEQSGTAGDYRINHGASNTNCSGVPRLDGADNFCVRTAFDVASGLTTGQACIFRSVNSNAFLAWSFEL